MTKQIAIRLAVSELTALDHEVAEGRASNRSDAVRRAIAYLQRAQRYRDEEAKLIELARNGETHNPRNHDRGSRRATQRVGSRVRCQLRQNNDRSQGL